MYMLVLLPCIYIHERTFCIANCLEFQKNVVVMKRGAEEEMRVRSIIFLIFHCVDDEGGLGPCQLLLYIGKINRKTAEETKVTVVKIQKRILSMA